ncbi:MAG TPA: ATP synthase A1 subunit C [Thermoplasmata archaeon]|nr:ATP synthase A1 subunit C [Thermoplasmata archaeon]
MLATSAESGVGNYAYAVARVKVRKAKLLGRESYLKMMGMSLIEIARFLGETQFSRDIHELGLRFKDVDLIEHAMSSSLARASHEVLGFCQGTLRDKVASYLERWDVYNLKTLLRGKLYGEEPEKLRHYLVPGGSMGDSALAPLLQAEGVDGVIEGLEGSQYHEVLAAVRARSERILTVEAFENALDKAYYQSMIARIRVSSRADQVYLNWLRKEIDVVNLRNLFELKRENVEPPVVQELMVPGGLQIKGVAMSALVNAESYDATLAQLEQFSFYKDVREEAETVRKGGAEHSLVVLERALDRHLARTAVAFSHLDPLSVLPVIDYLLRLKIEVDNVRIIVRGKEKGMEDERMRKLLVM